MSDNVNHPAHYGGEENPYEAIKVIEAWKLGFNLGNTLKYILRSQDYTRVESGKWIDDLKKAAWYLDRGTKELMRNRGFGQQVEQIADREAKIKQLFHYLWGKATDAANYNKQEWSELQKLLNV